METKIHIPFSPPDVGEEEIEQIAAALRSGWITTGPRTKELERQIAAYIGTEKCVCLNSQTACAEMALRLLGVGPGDEVITSAYTYTASASVIAHVGAKIVLIDIQPDCYEMDYDAVEAAVTERTKAIIPVDIGGFPVITTGCLPLQSEKNRFFTVVAGYRKRWVALPLWRIPHMHSGQSGRAKWWVILRTFLLFLSMPSKILPRQRADA